MEKNNLGVTVAELGEQQVLQRLYQFCETRMVGDDAAVLTPRAGHLLVVTTDMLVDGIHFCDRTTSPADVGWRSAAANLSDIAAMGASPLGLTISLGLPETLPVSWLDQFYQGVADCLNTYGTAIIGGDLSRSPVITVSMTALGEVSPHQQILRSTAQPGDAIVVTGVHGSARAGLELLLHPDWGQVLSSAEYLALKQAHQRPQPRLDVIQALQQLTPVPRVTGMDSSDGLADAVLQICRASGVGAEILQTQIPIPMSFNNTQVLTSEQAIEWALYGGEDFELVLCLPLPSAQELLKRINPTAMIIGQIVAEGDVTLLKPNGEGFLLEMQKGYQHFQ
ncbi:thiamine-phosphate kinase [Acaryochloris marina]|uniref:Thiamine-monophosphate kinase n=1 Tax=Acaryochloris marina (strain MBIC 11017) TaxID=329726 RepID=B0CD63_ACAM1|nr:thiamine-phosphate kinase [Acaryochloris marina]ABW25654.1 thiamine-monophosphate kinase [Acaryochloris marina MBIC11017]BDM80526.1 thiamine-monophosphate kinase [Acaryochloris marina MBIC10699]